jgi:hypothetical protein
LETVTESKPIDAREYLRHSVATLAYRGGKVLRGAPESFGAFRAADTSRTPSEILAHLCDLLDWSASHVRGREAYRTSTPAAWDADVARFFGALRALDDALVQTGRPFEWPRLLQGPIADALTHVGQLALLRRLAGFPLRGESYFRADIAAGRVGPEQAAPIREFD